MKKIVSLFSVLFLCFIFSSCDDYFETGIEGQWQMRTMIYPDGKQNSVDSVFYLFKKDVFKFIRMENDLDWYSLFGMYKEEGESLKITLDLSTEPEECLDCVGWGGNTERTFAVKKRNSSELILEYADTTYVFRKY